jgi:hypothetical protein
MGVSASAEDTTREAARASWGADEFLDNMGWFGRCVTRASSVYPVSEVLGVIIPEPSRRPHDIATLTKGTLKGI